VSADAGDAGNPAEAPAVAAPGSAAAPGGAATPSKAPLYWRLLRLRHIRPNGWQRAILVEGVAALSIVLVLADVATAWTLLVLPLSSAALVKGHDVLAGLLRPPSSVGSGRERALSRPG
jgi:hypothetical protein